MIPTLANHLWQIDAFAAVAGLLTLALRQNRAQMRLLGLAGRVAQVSDPFFLAGLCCQPVRVASRTHRRASAVVCNRADH